MDSGTGTFTDPLDGRVYRTVKIGNQIWMAENLSASKYCNGDPIPEIQNVDEWGESPKGAWCYYDNNVSNRDTYGKLYNWYAVNEPRGLAPNGWHIPTDEEWKELELYLGMSQIEVNSKGWRGLDGGGKLKDTATLCWHKAGNSATNESGFTALPGGYRDVSGDFYTMSYSGYFWTSTEQAAYFAWYRSLYYTHNEIHRTVGYVGDGFSVRCIKDN